MSYRVDGKKILHNGQEIQIYGVNIIGWETKNAIMGGLWTNQNFDDFLDTIVSMGFNCLRIPIGRETITNSVVPEGVAGIWQGSVNEKWRGKRALELLEMFLDECERKGVRYFFDWHYLENGIPDLWYTAAYPESQWLADLTFLAQHFKGRPGFIGIDTKNEPNKKTATWGDGSNKDWKLASEKSFAAINAVNKDILIIVEALGVETGLKQLFSNPLNIPADRLVLSLHVYGPDVWGKYTNVFTAARGIGKIGPVAEHFKASNFPANMPGLWDDFFGTVAETKCVLVGEFGGWYGLRDPKDKVWHDTLVAYLKGKGILNFTYWGLGENSGDECGGMLADGGYKKVRDDKVEMLRTLWTKNANFIWDVPEVEPTPIPTPIPIPVPTPTPTPIPVPTPQPTPKPNPAGDVAVGNEYAPRWANGVLLTVTALSADGVKSVYSNPKSGTIEFVTVPKSLLLK